MGIQNRCVQTWMHSFRQTTSNWVTERVIYDFYIFKSVWDQKIIDFKSSLTSVLLFNMLIRTASDILPTTKISAMHLLLYSRYSLLAAALQGIFLQKKRCLPVTKTINHDLSAAATANRDPNSYQPPLLSTHPQCQELSGLWRFTERGYLSDLHLESIR